ncbi:hypothetical protein BC477_10395 [Clavibacter michiganensis subsp. michiganensis]|uniref:Uncharacterized protein n=1 Tax=Clavibacter michiganensis subsp. michiganensis TaxID=33013 RepID=A0A251XQ02_CLAMM|nr:hypothetical protein BC477_10395 [Clavibacter michiganensis subsp. michiganensis]OUE05138.1 hypothetical protein CMMCAS07_09315 [Clavibacter michiganensis subsp. michiganensis]
MWCPGFGWMSRFEYRTNWFSLETGSMRASLYDAVTSPS